MSNGSVVARSIAASPVATSTTLCPSRLKDRFNVWRRASSSSTTRMLRVSPPTLGATLGGAPKRRLKADDDHHLGRRGRRLLLGPEVDLPDDLGGRPLRDHPRRQVARDHRAC